MCSGNAIDALPRFTHHSNSIPDIQGGYVANNWFCTIVYLQYFNKRKGNTNKSLINGEGFKKTALLYITVIGKANISQQLTNKQYNASKINVKGITNL